MVVRVHLSRLWTDTQVQKKQKAAVKLPVTKPWLGKVRVPLSRLWTEAQVQN